MPSVSFDLDGVLIRNPFQQGVIPRIRAHIRRGELLCDLEPAAADARIDAAIREAWGARMEAGDFVAAYDWDSIYGEVCRRFGGDGVPSVAGLVEELCGAEGMIALLPGARECLEELRDRGMRLVAATNGYRAYQWPVLEALGIAGLFAEMLSPDGTGFAKPSPEYFRVVPDLVAHVGDTLEHDVLGANLARLTSLWYAPELPLALRRISPRQRTADPQFTNYLESHLAGSPYRQYHPGPSRGYLPDLVAAELAEVPDLLDHALGGHDHAREAER